MRYKENSNVFDLREIKNPSLVIFYSHDWSWEHEISAIAFFFYSFELLEEKKSSQNLRQASRF